MSRVRLEIGSGLSLTLGHRGAKPLVLEKEMPDGATVGDLLRKLASGHKALTEAIFDPVTNELNGPVVIAVNGQLLPLRGLGTAIKDGDNIMLLPFIDGG